MNGIIVKLENVNGKQVPAVTSQQLAEVFGKEHYNVLRDIRETVAKCSKSFCALNFEGAEYLDEQGKSRPMYLMTKDGFTMVAMAYTTPEAMRFNAANTQPVLYSTPHSLIFRFHIISDEAR